MKVFRYADVGGHAAARRDESGGKEYVAAQDPADPGVLVLSQFAGAANELTSALIVNPYDRDDVANALNRALTMPLAERISRHSEMMETIVKMISTAGRRVLLTICARSSRKVRKVICKKIATFPKLA